MRGCGPSKQRREGAVWAGRGPRPGRGASPSGSREGPAGRPGGEVEEAPPSRRRQRIPGRGGGALRGSGWGVRPGWGAGRAGRDARSKCNDFSVRLAKQGQSRERSRGGPCPAGRVCPFRRRQSGPRAPWPAGGSGVRGRRPGEVGSCRPAGPGQEVSGTGWGEAGEGGRGHRGCGMC